MVLKSSHSRNLVYGRENKSIAKYMQTKIFIFSLEENACNLNFCLGTWEREIGKEKIFLDLSKILW